VVELKKSISQKLRMDGRDYARPGWYFVTLGADYHRHFFGEIHGAEMHPNALGQLVERCWQEIPGHYPHIALGAWQVMPTHFHGIVHVRHHADKALGEVINMFKGSVTRLWRKSGATLPVISRHGGKGPEPAKVWAPNYYDVICFDEQELQVREAYVRANPRRWALRDVPCGELRAGVRYKGNKDILRAAAPRQALRVSRRATEREIAAMCRKLEAFGGIVCSTFFSPGERACLQTVQQGEARIVWVLPTAMPAHIPVSWSDAFLQKRALWISTFPDDLQTGTRESCQLANRRVERFCQPRPTPQGTTPMPHKLITPVKSSVTILEEQP